tara:strand:+ start:198 stop:1130 length:933 start_codon:yes stop_codon:yes gene_type:complete
MKNPLKIYTPKIFSKINKLIPFQNYSISYFKGGYESFGNNIQQIALGIIFCNINGYNFYLSNHPYITDFKVINNPLSDRFSFFKKKYRFYYFDKPATDFLKRKDYFNNKENDFPISEQEKQIYNDKIHQVVQKYIRPNLHIHEENELSKDTLVIHIRSSDVFDNDWHSMYVQNPLSYFLMLIDKYEKIVIVTKDLKNPVIEKLSELENIEIKSSNFKDDLNIMMNAKNLASSGVGTFVIAAALLSVEIKKYYCSQYYLSEHLNPTMIKNVEINSFNIDDYIEIGNFKKSEKNLEKLLSEKIKVTKDTEYE